MVENQLYAGPLGVVILDISDKPDHLLYAEVHGIGELRFASSSEGNQAAEAQHVDTRAGEHFDETGYGIYVARVQEQADRAEYASFLSRVYAAPATLKSILRGFANSIELLRIAAVYAYLQIGQPGLAQTVSPLIVEQITVGSYA